jgi:MFS transporter, ACS family, glucarate transporter
MSSTAQKRWEVLIFIFLVSVVTYLDRINISIAGDALVLEYGLTRLQLGTIFGAFVLGYGLFQVPGGWLGDSFGYKRVLVIALIWWSVTTSLTAWAGRGWLRALVGLVPAFLIVRFLIGVGEAATFPCGAGLIGQWFSEEKRAFASGFMIAGVGVGSALTPPLIALVMVHWGWRSAFYVSSAIGLILALAFFLRVPTFERESSLPNHYEQLALDVGVKQKNSGFHWHQILKDRDVWLLTLSDFLNAYIAYIYFFWFYLYLVNVRGFSLLRGSYFATLPFLAMAVSSPVGGWLSDSLVESIGKVRSRRLVAMGGLIPSALLICWGASATNAYWAITALALAAGFLYLSLGCYWATAIEIHPTQSATVSGIMNAGANLGGALSPILTAWIAGRYGWVLALRLAAVLGLAAAAMWIFIGRTNGHPECGTLQRGRRIFVNEK